MWCLRPHSTRNCGWATDLARGCEWTQKFWRRFKWILNCLVMCQTRPKCTILGQRITKKVWAVSFTKNSRSVPGAARKILQRGRKVTKHGTGDVCAGRWWEWGGHVDDGLLPQQWREPLGAEEWTDGVRCHWNNHSLVVRCRQHRRWAWLISTVHSVFASVVSSR